MHELQKALRRRVLRRSVSNYYVTIVECTISNNSYAQGYTGVYIDGVRYSQPTTIRVPADTDVYVKLVAAQTKTTLNGNSLTMRGDPDGPSSAARYAVFPLTADAEISIENTYLSATATITMPS